MGWENVSRLFLLNTDRLPNKEDLEYLISCHMTRAWGSCLRRGQVLFCSSLSLPQLSFKGLLWHFLVYFCYVFLFKPWQNIHRPGVGIEEVLQGSNWDKCRKLGIQVEIASVTKLQERVQTLGQVSACMLFRKHRGLQANRDGDVMCWHLHPGLQTGCVFICRGFGVSVLYVHDCVLPTSAFACSAYFPPLLGMPNHMYLLNYLQTFHLFHINTNTQNTYTASPLRRGLILPTHHSRWASCWPHSPAQPESWACLSSLEWKACLYLVPSACLFFCFF